MSTSEFVISLFCRIDDALPNQTRHPRERPGFRSAKRWLSAVWQKGQLLDWCFTPANPHDTAFLPLVEQHATVQTLAGIGFHRADKQGGDPPNFVICGRGEENRR